MSRIFLVAGSRTQKNSPAAARDLYQGELFRYGLQYAEKAGGDRAYILSPKYGIVRPDDIIEPYKVSFASLTSKQITQWQGVRVMYKKDRTAWRALVARQLSGIARLDKDIFVVLAGKEYVEHLRFFVAHIEEPLKGHALDTRLPLLQRKIREEEYRRGRKWNEASHDHAVSSSHQGNFWPRFMQPFIRKIWALMSRQFGAKNDKGNKVPFQRLPAARIPRKKVLLLCGGTYQKDTAAPARELYLGELFRFSLRYAEKLKVDKAFVLSAKYGVVELSEIIEPYKISINNNGRLSSHQRGVVQPMNDLQRDAWVKMVIQQLSVITDLEMDFFIVFGGKRHRYLLYPFITHLEGPGKKFECAWQAYQDQKHITKRGPAIQSPDYTGTEISSTSK